MGDTDSETRPGRRAGESVSSDLDRVRQVAVKDKDARFTALMHHVSYHRLMLAFDDLKKGAAPGVDGMTWQEFDQDWQGNLRDLHGRVQSGRYRASPSRRVHIPKADGRQRPPGIATVTSYCPSCRGVWGFRFGAFARRWQTCCQAVLTFQVLVYRRWRGLVRRAAGLRCPDAAMRSRQAASMRSFQVMQSRLPGPRRASSWAVSVQ